MSCNVARLRLSYMHNFRLTERLGFVCITPTWSRPRLSDSDFRSSSSLKRKGLTSFLIVPHLLGRLELFGPVQTVIVDNSLC